MSLSSFGEIFGKTKKNHMEELLHSPYISLIWLWLEWTPQNQVVIFAQILARSRLILTYFTWHWSLPEAYYPYASVITLLKANRFKRVLNPNHCTSVLNPVFHPFPCTTVSNSDFSTFLENVSLRGVYRRVINTRCPTRFFKETIVLTTYIISVSANRSFCQMEGLWRLPFVRTGRPDQSLSKWNGFFPEGFAEKPSPSCILFRIWLIWLDSFD